MSRVRVVRTARRVFTGPAEFVRPRGHRLDIAEYLSDMGSPYGLTLADGLFEGATASPRLGHSYGEMARALIDAVVSPAEPVDLLVLAFAIPDVRPGRATATYLSHLCPGNPPAFAVCDQGNAAAFTGLRLVREYLGAAGRALLLIVEQSMLPYGTLPDGCGTPRLPDRHAAVALLCEAYPDGPVPAGSAQLVALRQHTDVAPEFVGHLLAGEVERYARDRENVTLIVGTDVATAGASEAGEGVTDAPEGQPYTGVWWELAGLLDPVPDPGRRVVLAEYDPALRYLCLCATDLH